MDTNLGEKQLVTAALDQSLDRGRSPILPRITNNMQEKIWSFQFIDLDDMLMYTGNISHAKEISLFQSKEDPHHISFETKREKNKIFNLWFLAFSNYANMGSHYPQIVNEMIRYMNIIFGFANNSIWQLVYQYDLEFRMEVVMDPQLCWDTVHNAVLGRTILSLNFANTMGNNNSNSLRK